MEFNWDKFLSAYQTASDEQKSFIDSPAIADCVKKLVDSDLIKPVHQQLLIVAISHYVLKSTSENEIVKILEANGVTNTLSILAKVVVCLESQNLSKGTNVGAAVLDSEIKAAEHDLASLQAVRTMTGDMRALGHADDIPVYRSLQDDILTPTPQADTPTTPRWESESTR